MGMEIKFEMKNSDLSHSSNFMKTWDFKSQENYIYLDKIKAEKNKMKTRKSVSKRFKITGTGKIIRRQCGKKHLNEKKDKNRKNSLSTYRLVAESDLSNVTRCLPYIKK